VAGGEVLAVALEHDHAHVLVGRGPRPGRVQGVQEFRALGVGDLRAVQGDDGHALVDLVEDLVHG